MKLDKETVLELMNEAASYHGPMISVSKERIIDLCDTALYAVAPVPEERDIIIEECAAVANRDLQNGMSIQTTVESIRALKRSQPQNGSE